MKSLYILGANGYIGSHLVRYFKNKDYTVYSDRIEVTDLPALRTAFAKTKPDAVINCVGVRAYPNVDWCEDHKEGTVLVNVAGAVNVMVAAIDAGAHPIQVTSGCIYNGGPDTVFTEDDEPNFFGSFYSRMRIVLQNALKELPVLQARIRMPISMYTHPRNLITKIASYEKVISVPNSVTLLEDLAPMLERAAEEKVTGILNVTNEGYAEHSKILGLYKEIVDPQHEFTLISLDDLEKDIVRASRSNCVLSTKKARGLGLALPPIDEVRWREILEQYKKSLTNSAGI